MFESERAQNGLGAQWNANEKGRVGAEIVDDAIKNLTKTITELEKALEFARKINGMEALSNALEGAIDSLRNIQDPEIRAPLLAELRQAGQRKVQIELDQKS